MGGKGVTSRQPLLASLVADRSHQKALAYNITEYYYIQRLQCRVSVLYLEIYERHFAVCLAKGVVLRQPAL